jgi:hypothetical protein
LHYVFVGLRDGQHHDGDAAEVWVALDVGRRLASVPARQVEVHEDEIGASAPLANQPRTRGRRGSRYAASLFPYVVRWKVIDLRTLCAPNDACDESKRAERIGHHRNARFAHA